MKLSLLSFALFLFPFCSFSQIENFDISKYKLADTDFRALDNTIWINGSYQHGSNPNVDFKNWRSNLNFVLESRYKHFINSRKEQSRIAVETKLNFRQIGRKGDDPNIQFTGSFSSNFDRNFFHENEVFTGLGSIISISHSRSMGALNFQNIQLYLPFSAGIGRIENVTDAWLGIRMLNDLKRLSVLKESPSEEQILNLAKFISQRQNLRFFDSRLKRIADIEELDDFLHKNGLVNAQGAKYFNSLYDQWLFGANTIRQSGNAFTFRISPYATYSQNQRGLTGAGFGSMLGVNYTHMKPLNLKWQFNKSVGIYAGGLTGGIPNIISGLGEKYSLESQINLELGYYPNSRTFLSFDFYSAYKISDDVFVSNVVFHPINDFSPLNSTYSHLRGFRFIGDFKTEYYLTPQSRLSGRLYLNYIQNNQSSCGGQGLGATPADRITNCFQVNYELQFSHSFF